MVELRDEDRRALTAGVLRINKASSAVASSSQSGQWEVIAPDLGGVTWKEQLAWDGNSALGSIRFVLQRTMFAASEQARGLAELARSSFGYTVALATLARGSVEALSRANWVLSSGTADEMLIRHASLEYADLRYPLQHGLAVRHQGNEGDVWVATSR